MSLLPAVNVRAADEVEIDHLARIWYEGWHHAHAQIVPPALTRLRTLESFRERLEAALPSVRVVGSFNEPAGFCMVKGDELYQLFVSANARGSGVAAALIADAEARLADSGVETAWLACAIGNERAARFYEKCGWHRTGNMVNQLETPNGIFPLDVWRYEKRLRQPHDSTLGTPGSDSRMDPDYAGELREVTERTAAELLRVAPDVAARRPAPDKWSIKEIVGHLIDSASNNHQRFVRAQWTSDLVVSGYDQDAWVASQRYQDAAWPELVLLWRELNRHLAWTVAAIPTRVRELERHPHNLDQIAFQRVPTDERVTLDYLMRDYVDHLKHHLRQISDLL